MRPDYTIVIPTTGRDSLAVLLRALESGSGPCPAEIIVVDDRPSGPPLELPAMTVPMRQLRSGGRGPAAARNAGWWSTGTEWVAFLDDDVIPGPSWAAELAKDLALPAVAGASKATIVVPAPDGRRPTDDERGTACLATAKWITADMAYRRAVLAEVGGFDEDFPRAYREDADLALRVLYAGYRIVDGQRVTTHPPRRTGFLASVRAQAGNADNALMRHKHGPRWRENVGGDRGRLGRHALATAGASAAIALAGPRRTRRVALACAALWTALTAEFTLRRILPGPRTPAEITRMLVTSVLIPPAACAHRIAGEIGVRRRHRPAAVLFDRDDTLITDVQEISDPELVRPVPGARAALDRVRAAGLPVGVVSNQAAVARGAISAEQLAAVNARVEELLGPFQTWQVCVHHENGGCPCHKPKPGLVRQAAAALGVDPRACVLIGDTGRDVTAATAAGALGILVPTVRTRAAEITWARHSARVATDLTEAVDLVLGKAR
jgi:histidinol-phosphate phosphatase family protein